MSKPFNQMTDEELTNKYLEVYKYLNMSSYYGSTAVYSLQQLIEQIGQERLHRANSQMWKKYVDSSKDVVSIGEKRAKEETPQEKKKKDVKKTIKFTGITKSTTPINTSVNTDLK